LCVINMIITFHLIALLLIDYFTPEWQKNVRDISREVVDALLEASYEDDVFFD